MTPPLNQVAFEGTTNTIMTCNGNPNKISWTVFPTDNELLYSQITNYNHTVLSNLTTLYDVIQTNLTIKTAQSSPALKPITTSGTYVAQYNTSTSSRIGAKLVVIRK